MTEKRRVSELKVNPLSEAIYGSTYAVSDLVESIRQHGLLSPIIIKPDETILSGHRRFAAVKELGWEEVECVVREPKDEADEEVYVIESNRSRLKTMRQLICEGKRLKVLLGEAATTKRNAMLNQGMLQSGAKLMEPQAKVNTGARIASSLGISSTLWGRLEYIDKYAELGIPVAVDAAALLDAEKITVNKAYSMIRKAIAAMESAEPATPDTPEAPEQSINEYNIACKESVAGHIQAICEILEKVEELEDKDFNTLPWRTLTARVRMLNRYFAKLDERVAKKRGRAFENMAKLEEVKDDGEDK